jgi:ABC-type transporter lipoprotein component MlaA
LHLNQFEEADRYAIDLYGAVQDAYLQTRRVEVRDLKEGK